MTVIKKIGYSFYGVEYQCVFAITECEHFSRFNCIIEEACENSPNLIFEGESLFSKENDMVESKFRFPEIEQTDVCSEISPFSGKLEALALLRAKELASTVSYHFFSISHEKFKNFFINREIKQSNFDFFIYEEINKNI